MSYSPPTLALIFAGVLGGIIVGIIPGLSTTMAVAIMIPFTFAMRPEVAMSLLVAVFVGGVSGGLVTAILVRMPGTPASISSILDGFPMAQKGQAGQAIGNAIIASFFGTVISGVILVLLAPVLATFAMRFHFAEYVAVAVFALAAVVSISGDSLLRGAVTCLVGLICCHIRGFRARRPSAVYVRHHVDDGRYRSNSGPDGHLRRFTDDAGSRSQLK